jgi:hypothetical protein
MKALTPVLAGIAVVSGIVSANLWRELRASQLTNAELRTQLAHSRIATAQPGAPAQLPTPAPQPVSAAPAPAGASTPASASQQTADPAKAAAAAATATAALTTIVSTLGTGDQDLMKDPEYRKARLTQTRIQIARSYPGLAEELGLSEREANQLFELMAVSQLNMTNELTTSIVAGNAAGSTASTQDAATRVQRMQAQNRELEDSLRTMLGNKYSQYQDYQQTRSARTQAVTLGSQLTAAGQPLSDAQSRALTTAMIAEQQRQRQQPQAAPLAPPAANSTDAQARTVLLLEDSLRRQEETNRNVLAAASAHLNASQVAVLRQQFDQQNASRRQTLTRMQEQAARQQTPPRPQ